MRPVYELSTLRIANVKKSFLCQDEVNHLTSGPTAWCAFRSTGAVRADQILVFRGASQRLTPQLQAIWWVYVVERIQYYLRTLFDPVFHIITVFLTFSQNVRMMI